MKKYIKILMGLMAWAFIIYCVYGFCKTGSPMGLYPLFIWLIHKIVQEDKRNEQSNIESDVEC